MERNRLDVDTAVFPTSRVSSSLLNCKRLTNLNVRQRMGSNQTGLVDVASMDDAFRLRINRSPIPNIPTEALVTKKQANATFIFLTCSLLGIVNAMIVKVLYDSPTNTLVNDLMTHFGISSLTSLMAGILLVWMMIGLTLGVYRS